MRILILSDSHSDRKKVREAVELMRDSISAIIHLGDGERDMYFDDGTLDDFQVYQVRGNCDYASELPDSQLVEIRNKRIFVTHGHNQKVKYTRILLEQEAKKYNADIVLYGHTHKAVTEYVDNTYYFNPGSLREGKFGYIDIVQNSIRCVNLDLHDFY